MGQSISTEELAQRLGEPDLALVDGRDRAAYNGWRLKGERRGGHIPGAIRFPYAWLSGPDAASAGRLLKEKGITHDKTIITYHDDGPMGKAMTHRLEGLGYERVFFYEDGFLQWSATEQNPVDRLPNYHILVHPAWILELLNSRQPEAAPRNQYQIVEAGGSGIEAFEKGHIPGAIFLDTNDIEKPPGWNRIAMPLLRDKLASLGLTSKTTIILASRDILASARAAHLMMLAGVEDVRLLDGGLAAWIAAEYPLESGLQRPSPAPSFGPVGADLPHLVADLPEVRQALASEETLVISVRSWPEFIGQTSGYPFIEPKGRIAGAKWGRGGTDAHDMSHFRDSDGVMRSHEEIQAFWLQAGITANKRILFYCGTGWRASEAFLCAHVMGWPDIAVYDGGWLEWSADPSNPVETGEPG